ncbi:MAG: hypothetical protein AB8G86_15835, partial [Saprospiraceae bacterium]
MPYQSVDLTLAQLAEQVDIPSKAAIIYSSSDRKGLVLPEFPNLFGNHMILYVPSEDMWLECTSNVSPPGYVGSHIENRYSLLTSSEGGELVMTPKLDETSNQKIRTSTLSLT